jgi:Leucine-rich repeat (LRR) protein
MVSLGWIQNTACDSNSNAGIIECEVILAGETEGDTHWSKRVTKVSLDGTLPPGPLGALQNLTALKRLALSEAQVSGDISALAELTELEVFYARSAPGVTGDLAVFRNMPNLKQIYVARTPDIFGAISNFQGARHLAKIEIQNLKNMTGPLSVFRDMHDLFYMNMEDSGIAGDIESLENVKKLQTLILTRCSSISGDLESLRSLLDLRYLSLVGTGVSGEFNSLDLLHDLAFVGLTYLDVTGNIEGAKSMDKLTRLYLKGTRIEGHLSALAELTALTDISLEGTSIKGVLGDLNSLVNLQYLRLENTMIGGSLDSILDMTELRSALFHNCGLEGEIPHLDNTRLEILDVSNNALRGRALPRLPMSMKHLNLDGNDLFVGQSSIDITLASTMRYMSVANNAMDEVNLLVEIERSAEAEQVTTLDFRGAGIKCPLPEAFSLDGVVVFRDACEYDFVPMLIVVATVTGAMVLGGVLLKQLKGRESSLRGNAIMSKVISRVMSYHPDTNTACPQLRRLPLC